MTPEPNARAYGSALRAWFMVGVTMLLIGGALSDGWPTVDLFVCSGLWCLALALTYLVQAFCDWVAK